MSTLANQRGIAGGTELGLGSRFVGHMKCDPKYPLGFRRPHSKITVLGGAGNMGRIAVQDLANAPCVDGAFLLVGKNKSRSVDEVKAHARQFSSDRDILAVGRVEDKDEIRAQEFNSLWCDQV